MLDGDKQIFMAITLNLDIVVNKRYLYNYSEKLQYNWYNELEKKIDQIYWNNILHDENKQKIKILKI